MKRKIKQIITFIVVTVICTTFFPIFNQQTVSAANNVYYGIDYSSVFNADFYSMYPDLRGMSHDDLLRHFVQHGMHEGRQASQNFDLSYYKSYPDLYSALKNNNAAYYMHYIYHGQYEGRIAANTSYDYYANTVYNGIDYYGVFNPLFYYILYPDLRQAFGYNPDKLLEHFANHGIYEGRIGNGTFDVNYYMSYPDLRQAFGNNVGAYREHYVKHGQFEGRRINNKNNLPPIANIYGGVDYSLVFDANYYYSRYPDLRNYLGMSPKRLLAHFVDHGMSEGRNGNSSFNVHYYRSVYPDLAGYGSNLKAYYNHYIFHGYYEGRTGKANVGWYDIDGKKYYYDNYGNLQTMFGVDVSSYQGQIDWQAAKNNGVEFAIIRIGWGSDDTGQDDPYALYNISECQRLGIPYGVYIYSYAYDYNMLQSEINHTLRILQSAGVNPPLGVYFDMEDADGYKANNGVSLQENGSLYNDFCYRFCETMKAYGYSTGVYASYNVFANYLDYNFLSTYYNIWLAHWGISSPSVYCNTWQYTSSGYVSGIPTRVDMNIYYRSGGKQK